MSQLEAATTVSVLWAAGDPEAVRLARLITDTAEADAVAAGLDVAAACLAASPAAILWLAMLMSLKARRIGLEDGKDIKVPEGMPTPIVKGGKVLNVVTLELGTRVPLVIDGLNVTARDTGAPPTVATPEPGYIVSPPTTANAPEMA